MTVAGGAVFLLWTQLEHGAGWTWVPLVVAAGTLVASIVAGQTGREGWAFSASGIAVATAIVVLFGSLYPDVMPSTTDPAFSLTVENASSTDYTLEVMTVVALVMTPIVLLYQGWTYWVFRQRIGRRHIPPATGHGGRRRRPPAGRHHRPHPRGDHRGARDRPRRVPALRRHLALCAVAAVVTAAAVLLQAGIIARTLVAIIEGRETTLAGSVAALLGAGALRAAATAAAETSGGLTMAATRTQLREDVLDHAAADVARHDRGVAAPEC